jgi:hypothetical protein
MSHADIASAMASHYKPPETSTLEDVAKTVPSKLGQGAIDVLGLPGDAATALNKGVDWLESKIGLTPQKMPYQKPGEHKFNPLSPFNIGSEDIQSEIEKHTGKFYEPKTTTGKIIGGAARALPGALATGGESLVGNAIRYGAIPGAAAEAAGLATEGTSSEPYARAGAGLATGGLAGVLTQPRTAERFIRGQLPDYVTKQHIEDAGELIRDSGKINLTWPEALTQVTGKPVLLDMQRLLEGAKQTRSTMQEALGGRPQAVQEAVKDQAANIAPQTAQPSTIGPAIGEAAEGRVNEVRQTINQVSEPFYDAAKTHTLTPQEMAQVRAIPGYAAAAKAVRRDPQLNREVAHLPEESIGFLNEVKKQLDQAAQNAASPVQQGRSVQRAAGLGRDAAAVRDAAIGSEASAGQANYAQALNIQELGRQRHLEPLLQGPLGKLAEKDIGTQKAIDALFPKEPLPGSENEVRQTVHALSQRAPDTARQLVRAHVEAKLDEAFHAAGRSPEAAGFAGARFANEVAGSPVVNTQRGENFRAAVEALPNGKRIMPGVNRLLEVLQATGNRQPIGSKTAFNKADLHAMETGGSLGNVLKTAASPGEWWHWAHEMMGKWQSGNNLGLLAKIITDPRAEAVFQRIAKRGTSNQEALNLAARLTFAIGAGSMANARKISAEDQR